MAFIDYYKILGVKKDIAQDDLRAAYKKRAKQFHPDLHPNDPKAKAKFQALNEAYDVLSDPEKRKKYDQYGEHWKEAENFGAGGSGGFNWNGSGGSPFDGFDFGAFKGGGGFSSFFEELFGRGAKQSGGFSSAGGGFSSAGGVSSADSGEAHAKVSLDVFTAMLGGEIVIQLTDGTKLKLKVKPGTQPGSKVKLRGKGHHLGNGKAGDLIVTFDVQLPTNLTEQQKSLLRQAQMAGR